MHAHMILHTTTPPTSDTTNAKLYSKFKERLNSVWLELKKAVSAATSLYSKAIETPTDDPRVYSCRMMFQQSHGHLTGMLRTFEHVLTFKTMPDGGPMTDDALSALLAQTQSVKDGCFKDAMMMKAAAATPKGLKAA